MGRFVIELLPYTWVRVCVSHDIFAESGQNDVRNIRNYEANTLSPDFRAENLWWRRRMFHVQGRRGQYSPGFDSLWRCSRSQGTLAHMHALHALALMLPICVHTTHNAQKSCQEFISCHWAVFHARHDAPSPPTRTRCGACSNIFSASNAYLHTTECLRSTQCFRNGTGAYWTAFNASRMWMVQE